MTRLADVIIARSIPEPNTGCWLWLGHIEPAGHGKFTVRRGKRFVSHWAHRVAYEEFSGPVAETLCVGHRCGVPWCVNPAHLFLGTHAETVLDAALRAARRRHK